MTRKYRTKFQQKTAVNSLNEAKSLWDNKLLTDVTLLCGGEELAAHKVILAANSNFFRSYFIQEHNLPLAAVTIDFLKPEVLQTILKYFYSGRIKLHKEQTELQKSIMEASSLLQIPLLSNYCLEVLVSKVSREISISDWKVIEEIDSEAVSDIFLQKVIQKLDSLNTTVEFLQLSAEQLNMLFQCPKIAESDQRIVFQSILNWIKHDSDRRKAKLTHFLKRFVDFERLNPVKLFETQNEHLLFENDYFVRSYLQLLSKHMNGEPKNTIKKRSSSDRNKTQKLHKSPGTEALTKIVETAKHINPVGQDIAAFSDTFEEKQFFIYNFGNEESGGADIWLYNYAEDELVPMIAHPLLNKAKAAIVYSEGFIYAFGGTDYYNYTYNTGFCYDMKTKQWIETWPMLSYRTGTTALALSGYIYIVGGTFNGEPLKSIERYNPETDDWEVVADLLADNDETVPVAAVKDCLYVLIKTKLYKYTPQEKEGHLVDTELSNYLSTDDVHMCSGGERIFIIEREAPKTVLIYDPKENSINEDVIPSVLTECEGILDLGNPRCLEFLVGGIKKWFIYRPSFSSWKEFDPKMLKDFKLPMLTLLPD